MSITSLAMLAILGFGVIMTLRNPFYGVMLYVFEWHNHPPYWWWGGDLPDLRWSLTVALVMLVSAAINRKKLPQLVNSEYTTGFWLVLFALNAFLVSNAFAFNAEESFSKAQELIKIAINFMLMVYLIRRPKEYRMVILVMLLCVANFGKVAYEDGSNRDLGIMAPNATGGNPIAAHVMTTLPFFGIYFLTGKRWVKIACILAMPLVLNLLILENSRASMLGLGSMAILGVLYMKGKARFKVIGAIALGAILFLGLSNDQFWQTQESTMNYEQEGSAMSRIYLWRGAIELWKDYPMGVGGQGFIDFSMSYVPEIHIPKSVHNTYFAILTDWGILGIILYFGFLIHTFMLMMKSKKLAEKYPDFEFYYYEAIALQLAFAGILIAGIFHSRQYAEIVYWLGAWSLALRNMQKTEIGAIETNDQETLASFQKP